MTVWSVVWAAAGVLLVIAGSGATSESSEPRGPITPTPVEQTSAQPQEEAESGQCSAEDPPEDCSPCTWVSAEGVSYSVQDLQAREYQVSLQNPRGATMKFQLCSSSITCNGETTPSCLHVPGVKATSAGMLPRVEQLEPHLPGRGLRLVLDEGDVCEVNKKPRATIISLPCNPAANYKALHLNPRKAYEGQKSDICRYYVEFPASQFGCPLAGGGSGGLMGQHGPEIWAVTGCSDSDPLWTTSDCHHSAHSQLSLHGLNFNQLCSNEPLVSSPLASAEGEAPPTRATPTTGMCTQNFRKYYKVSVGPFQCKDPRIISDYVINCTVSGGSGKDWAATISRVPGEGAEAQGDVVASLKGAVSFREAIDFREKFSRFVELGVGGLKKEIDELYRRAFASRGTPPDVLEKLGVSHVKGILLYGPPGSGKTLLARTIAHILGSKQVRLINGPEVISKYLGESERNLRAHFKEAHDAWKELGPLSDLYVIIIDEIDAICKPRGKSDMSAAGVAYDALVNQLLTLLDGLVEVHNTLVVGLTNRRELMDSALLRPGRFEVQIEVNLPDEEGRREIFEIHTRTMRNSSLLAPDVDVSGLAANTSRFSGAEIAGVVRAAASYALERQQSGASDEVLVSDADFQRAILDVSPAYTHSESHVLSSYLPLGYLPCGISHEVAISSALRLTHTLKQGSTARIQTLLLYGPRGSGKTTLAAHIAVLGKFSYTKILTASSFVSRSDVMKVELLRQTFDDAFRSESAIVVLDDLHRLVEMVQVGTQITVSHGLLHAVNTLLTTTPPAGSKVLVVGTMTAEDEAALEEPSSLGLPELFVRRHLLPLLDTRGALAFLTARNIHKLGGGQFLLPSNLVISVRQLLHSIECACVQSDRPCPSGRVSPSHVQQDHLLDCIMTYVTR